jgi:hypothetical protein
MVAGAQAGWCVMWLMVTMLATLIDSTPAHTSQTIDLVQAYLRAASEASLENSSRRDMIRIVHIPSFHDVTIVRVDGARAIKTVVCGSLGAEQGQILERVAPVEPIPLEPLQCTPGTVLSVTEHSVSADEWQYLRQNTDRELRNADSAQQQTDPQRLSFDGVIWSIERVHRGKYRVRSQWAAGPEEFCKFVRELFNAPDPHRTVLGCDGAGSQ